MKHIKTFENLNNNFNIGDILIYKEYVGDTVTKNFCKLLNIDTNDTLLPYRVMFLDKNEYTWTSKYTLHCPTKEELEQYKLEQTTNKYNL